MLSCWVPKQLLRLRSTNFQRCTFFSESAILWCLWRITIVDHWSLTHANCQQLELASLFGVKVNLVCPLSHYRLVSKLVNNHSCNRWLFYRYAAMPTHPLHCLQELQADVPLLSNWYTSKKSACETLGPGLEVTALYLLQNETYMYQKCSPAYLCSNLTVTVVQTVQVRVRTRNRSTLNSLL